MGVEFARVSKRFGDVDALVDFSLEVDDGEFMVLLGPSGCGKTTALRILAGLEEPTTGEVSINGRVVTDLPAHDRDIAMVFQNYALYPHMSVYDNIAFGLRMRKIPRREIDRTVRETADLLAIGDLMKRRPGQLSGGQRQRVALGRAIVRRPTVFLMDEPLSNLDAKLRAQTRLELIRLHRRLQTTVLYVTHDQVEAMTMGARIAVLNEGRLQQVGSPQDIYKRPENLFVADFIGSPSTSFFRGHCEGAEDGRVRVLTADVAFMLSQAHSQAVQGRALPEVVVGVRPEHIEFAEQFGERATGATFDAHVDVVESLGNEIHATLLVDGAAVIARLPADATIRAGETRRFAIASEHLLIFDPETGSLIT